MSKKYSHKNPTSLETFYFGAPYYPEHWDAETRKYDAERMAAANFNVIRMAEFAWDLMEPKEGNFDFALFDETITAMGESAASPTSFTMTRNSSIACPSAIFPGGSSAK